MQLRINGRNYTGCAPAAPAEAAGPAAAGTQPPQFGAGARFCALGASWRNGDVGELGTAAFASLQAGRHLLFRPH